MFDGRGIIDRRLPWSTSELKPIVYISLKLEDNCVGSFELHAACVSHSLVALLYNYFTSSLARISLGIMGFRPSVD